MPSEPHESIALIYQLIKYSPVYALQSFYNQRNVGQMVLRWVAPEHFAGYNCKVPSLNFEGLGMINCDSVHRFDPLEL